MPGGNTKIPRGHQVRESFRCATQPFPDRTQNRTPGICMGPFPAQDDAGFPDVDDSRVRRSSDQLA